MTTTTVQNHTLLKASPLWLSADVDAETVLMHIETGDYFSISGVGVDIWQQVQTDISFAAVCQHLIAEFDITEDECIRASLTFINELVEQGIVDIHE